jgi:membrane protease YdiL (CAAX protease family)
MASDGLMRGKDIGMAAFKIGLIVLGLGEFAGILPLPLEALSKTFTAFLLLAFWYGLRPDKFLFGRESKLLNISIVTCFVVFSLDIYLRLLSQYDPSLALYLSPFVNTLVLFGRILFVGLVALFVAVAFEIGERSALHSFYYLFSQDRERWKRFVTSRSIGSTTLRFFLCFFSLFLVANYLFQPITQWSLVNLDNALLVVALILVFVQLKHENHEVLRRIGEFNERIFASVTGLFTDESHAYLGLGFLLIFFYLSELTTFFVSFLLPFIPFRVEYYSLDPTTHQSLWSLFTTETLTSPLNALAASWTYLLSGLGALALILIPVTLMFLDGFGADLRQFDWKKRYLIPLLLLVVVVSVFLIAPWVTQKPLIGSEIGAYGVDFITAPISSHTPFSFELVWLWSLILFFMVGMSLSRKASEFFVVILYIAGMMYFGYYCWNFYVSSMDNYTHFYPVASDHLDTIGHLILSLNRFTLPFIDLAFYCGGFVLLAYYLSRYVIENFLSELLEKRYVIIWAIGSAAFMVFLSVIITNANYGQTMPLFIAFVVVMTIFSAALSSVLGTEHQYIFCISMALVTLPLLGAVSQVMQDFGSIPFGWMNILVRAVFLIVVLLMVDHFNQKPIFLLTIRKALVAVVAGGIFGVLFLLIGEPLQEVAGGLPGLLIFLILVAISEELLFRQVVLRLLENQFGPAANFIQAALFAFAHFLFGGVLIGQLGLAAAAYGVAIFIFGYLQGILAEKSRIMYPILAHLAANLVLYLGASVG